MHTDQCDPLIPSTWGRQGLYDKVTKLNHLKESDLLMTLGDRYDGHKAWGPNPKQNCTVICTFAPGPLNSSQNGRKVTKADLTA